MRYERIYEGRFLDRPNRFIAHVEIGGNRETVHVKNTGRCAELLVPGAQVYVQKADNPKRKDTVGSDRGEEGGAAHQYGLPDPQRPCAGMAGGDGRRQTVPAWAHMPAAGVHLGQFPDRSVRAGRGEKDAH